MERKFLCALVLCVVLGNTAASQGEAVLPVLQVSPSAVSHGMGDASVAFFRDDPFASLDNPAHLGMFSQSNYFSAAYDYCDWLPGFQQSNLRFSVFGFNGGVNFHREFGIGPKLSIGLGYSRVKLDLGEFNETSPDGPEVISTFNAYEAADNYSVGVGLDFWVRLAVGYTFRQVESAMTPFNVQGQDRKGKAEISTYDLGAYFSAPLMEIVGNAAGAPITVGPGIRPLLDLDLGVAKNNIGDATVVYIDPDQPEPQPRFARAGVAIEAGVAYEAGGTDWRPVFFSWTRESNDLLVTRFPAPVDSNGIIIGDPPPPRYREGFGDIHFVDDVILGKSNPDVTIKTGWQLDFGEFITLRGGRYVRPAGSYDRTVTTSGYTVRLAGVLKILSLVDFRAEPGSVIAAVVDHLDVRYSHGTASVEASGAIVPNPTYNSWMVKYSN